MQRSGARPAVAIVGGGWAGLACALRLAQAGLRPVVFESAPEPGGRARRAKFDETYRDNGQHLLLAGCQALTRLLAELGLQLPQSAFCFTDGQRRLSLAGRRGRAGLLKALLGARGFTWSERIALCRALLTLQWSGWHVTPALTVAAWLKEQRQPAALIDAFWTPLALAILNTPTEQAAMARLAPVLRDTLGAGCESLAMIQPTANLSASVVAPWVNAIQAAGGEIRCGARVSEIESIDSGYEMRLQHETLTHLFDHVVLALPPWALTQLILPAACNAANLATRFGAQPIATVYLGFDDAVRLPTPLVQLPGPTQTDARVWAMDRAHCGEPGVMAIALSAEGPWTHLDHEALAQRCLRHLHAVLDTEPPCRWHKVVTVHRATPCATPDAVLTDQERQPLPGLQLAGDWTHAAYPATLEAAIQSGFDAAHRISASLPDFR